MHKGGLTSFVFVDGSTKLLPDYIDPDVFYALGTIQGFENVGRADF